MYSRHRYLTPLAPEHQYQSLIVVVIGASFGYALSCVLGGPTSDEGFHAPQIWHYYSGGREFASNITVPPTYHYIMAMIIRQIGYYSDHVLRLINLIISLCMLPVFYGIASRFYPSHASMRMLQLFYAPLMFPYFFLIYTDMWTLLATSLCLYYALSWQYYRAAFTGLFAICLRQDAVVWVGLVYLLVCFEGVSTATGNQFRQVLTNSVKKGFPLAIVLMLFIAFVLYNGGVAIGDREAHRFEDFNVSNLYVFLICAWLLFLPFNVWSVPKVATFIGRPVGLFCIVAGFLIYMGTFSNPHGYNNFGYDFFLHNGLLYLMEEYVAVRALLYIPIAWAAVTLCTMKLPEPRYYWMLLIIPLSAISHPLVEPRYYFPAYVLINIFRPPLPEVAEVGLVVFYAAVAAFIMFGTVTGMFFL